MAQHVIIVLSDNETWEPIGNATYAVVTDEALALLAWGHKLNSLEAGVEYVCPDTLVAELEEACLELAADLDDA